MGRKTAEPGDERNASFELPEIETQEGKPGFDPGEPEREASPEEGSHRFPRRMDEKSIPRGLIGDHVRRTRAKGA